MRHRFGRILVFVLASSTVFPALFAAEPQRPPPPPPPLANATLAPALKAAADRDHVKLYTIDPTSETPQNGDFCVAWVGASDGKGKRQWLIQLRRSPATEAEQKANRNRERTKYLSWGPVITFKSNVQALDLWIAGPVKSDDLKPQQVANVRRVRVLVPSDYLRLGLDDSLRVDQHMRRRYEALRKEDPKFNANGIYALDKAIKPENVASSKQVADKIQFTPEMERAWVGGYVALEAFYKLANDVPEIEAIASIAVEKPSVFKLAKLATGTQFMTFFGGPNTQAVDPAKLGLVPVALEAFDAPFSFGFGADAIVTGVMVVTKPMPPFDTTAGILAMIAIHPKDPNRQVHIAVISGVRGAAPTAP
jgi:hypothetical protein